MVNNRDLGLDGVARFLLFADYGDRPWVYWRPGWALLFWLVHGVAGTVAWPYYLVCIALHAAQSGAIAAIGSRASGCCLTGASAGVLFAVMPSHAGAVAWIAAAFNVVPAALCVLIAGWCCWRFANEGRARHGVAVVALTALSLTFKEAAYAMPLVAAAAISLVPTAVRWRQRVARIWLVGALAILVMAHHLALGRRDPVADGLALEAFALALAHHAAAYARSVLPILPNDDVAALGLTAALGVVVFVWGSPRVRFLAALTLAATLPYVVMSHSERFFYFCHAPAVLCATLFARELAQRCVRSPHVAHAAWLAVAALGLVRLPAALACAICVPAGRHVVTLQPAPGAR